MSIAGLLKTLSKREKNTFFNSPIFSFLNGQTPPKMGEKEFLMAYSGWVYSCVNAIAEEIASLKIKLQQSVGIDEWKDIQNNPSIQLLNNVNPFWTSSDLLFATAAFLELHGNAFWYLPRNGGGKPAEIWVLDPSRTWVVKSETEYIAGYVFQNEKGEKVPLDAMEIIHFKRFNPRNPYRGMGTVEAAAIAIDTNTFAAEYQRNFFGNSAMPSGVLSTDGTLNQDQYDRIRANWDAKFKGVDNAHKMAILEGGLKFQNISPSSKEMEFAQSRKDLRDEILATFRVPKSILGITEDVNRAAAESSEYVFGKRVVKPRMQFIVNHLNEFYLGMFGLDQTKYRFTFDDPVPQNQELAMQLRASAIQNYYMTPNEARAEIGLEPLEGGDELFIPTLVSPLSSTLVTETANTDEADSVDAPADQTTTPAKTLKKKSKKGAFNKDKYIAEQISSLTGIIEKQLTKLEKQLLKNLKNKKEIAASLRENKSFLERLKDVSEPVNELVRILFSDYSDWVGLLFNATQEGINNVYTTSGKQALLQVGIDEAFNLDNPRAMDFLNNHALDMATQVSETIKEDLILQLMQGVETGTSDDDVATIISSFFDTGSAWRADRIARTETINAYAQGNLEGWKQSDVVAGTKWVFDGGECKSGICPENAAAGIVPLGESFPSGDDAPPAHPNCECDQVPVTKSDE